MITDWQLAEMVNSGEFTDDELRLMYRRSGCVGTFFTWRGRAMGRRETCCDRDERLRQEPDRLLARHVEHAEREKKLGRRYEIPKDLLEPFRVLEIDEGSSGRVVRPGDCFAGLRVSCEEKLRLAEVEAAELLSEIEKGILTDEEIDDLVREMKASFGEE